MDFLTRSGHKKRRYELQDVLGAGGFSVVYRAYDRQLERHVAIKVSERRREAPAEHEERIGRDLRHPHIIAQIDAFKSRRHHYIVYELAEGRELFEHIVEQDHFSEQDARAATSAMVDALLYLHSNGIIHRDIKPENILYRKPPQPGVADDFVLADFGLAAYISDDLDATTPGHAGSPGYTAPEILEGRGAGRPADMFSLGLVAYAMLSGRTPFVSTDPLELNEETRRCHIAYPDRYWNGVSELAMDFVQRCLVRDPMERMSSFEALHHPWLASGLTSCSSHSSLESAGIERRPSDASSWTSYDGQEEDKTL